MRTVGSIERRSYPILGYPVSGLLLVGVRKSIHSPEQQVLLQLLRDLRSEAGLRQSDLAQRLGRPQSFVSKYEVGERRLDILELRSICQALDTDLAGLVERLERALR
jgi:DNA-binding XRE family transcriptional regulator